MISRTRMITLVRNFSADEVPEGLDEKPELLRYRDERGRNRLHLCADVDVCEDACKDVCRDVCIDVCKDVSRKTNLNTENSVRLGAVLLERGLDINAPAFTEGSWCATPLWYAVGRGHNLPLAKFLLKSGSNPEHCLWAASFSEDLEMLRLLVEAGASLEAVAEVEEDVEAAEAEVAKAAAEVEESVEAAEEKIVEAVFEVEEEVAEEVAEAATHVEETVETAEEEIAEATAGAEEVVEETVEAEPATGTEPVTEATDEAAPEGDAEEAPSDEAEGDEEKAG